MAEMTANSKAWEEAFLHLGILDLVNKFGFAEVTSNQLRRFREPRLMGKIDHEENLPQIFRKYGLTILAVSNQAYRIGRFDIFARLPEWTNPDSSIEIIDTPVGLETLNFNSLTSEPAVLNAAFTSQLLNAFCEDDLTLTVSGRMRTGNFDFKVREAIRGQQIVSVCNAQMEIDAGFEGRKGLYIFEAKNHSATNFNLRQLYYPTRSWSEKISKTVVPIFLTHSNDVFDLYKFAFLDSNELSSAVLTSHRRFMLSHERLTEKALFDIAKSTIEMGEKSTYPQYDAPFPQADNFGRIIDLVGLLIEEPRTVEELASLFNFDPRQSDYYFNAARYLGLAVSEKDDVTKSETRSPTAEAKRIFCLPYHEKYRAIASKALAILPVAQAFDYLVRNKRRPSLDQVTLWLDSFPPTANLAITTKRRRGQTINSWIEWLHGISRGQ